jgi:hypothetical protein
MIASENRKGFLKCNLSNYLLNSNTNIIEMTRIVGCASHSNFQSERDKVLDALLKRVTEIDHSGECMMGYQYDCIREDCTTCTVGFVIKEFRQKAGEP